MPINAHPEYLAAEKEYLAAETIERKILSLKKMISLMPKHKGAENLRAQLKKRLAKLISSSKKESKKSGGKRGIKKEEMQAVIIGKTNSGKSSLISLLTNVKPEISEFYFATKSPEVGIMEYPKGVKIQIVDVPSINSEYYDKSIANTADTILVVVKSFSEIEEVKNFLGKSRAKQIIVFNKIDLLNEEEKRKIFLRMKSNKYNFVMTSCITGEGIPELQDKIFKSMGKIRVYTKDPGKMSDKEKPIILDENSLVRDVAEKIFHGLSSQIKETRITGPSGKFPNQVVGLKHKLKDMDVVEFKIR